jgi:hypothetical protein
MSAKDFFHNAVKLALEKDGWFILTLSTAKSGFKRYRIRYIAVLNHF